MTEPDGERPLAGPASLPEAPTVVEVDLGLRIIFVLASIGSVGLTTYGFVHRANAGSPLDRGAVLFGLGFVVLPVSYLTWLGRTRVVITNDRVRVTTLFGTNETDRSSVIRTEGMGGSIFTWPHLILAEGASAVRISRRHPEGRPIGETAALSIPGISRPRLEAVLAGKPDPDDLDVAESVQLVKGSFVNDAGEPKWTVYAICIAGGFIVVIMIASGLSGSSS